MGTPMRIIDAHQHVFWAGRDDAGLIADMDERGIDKAVVLTWCLMNAVDEIGYARSLDPTHAVAGQVHPGLPFSDVMQAVRRYPDRLVPGYAPDPTDPRAIDWLAAAIQIHHVRVCGEWKFRLPMDDPRCLNVFAFCAEADLPVLFHLEVPYVAAADGAGRQYHAAWYGGSADNLERALRACPETTFIGHGPGFWRYISGDADTDPELGYPSGPVVGGGRLQQLLDNQPNLVAELSAASGRNALTRDPQHAKAFLQRYHDRMMFGRDCYDGTLNQALQSLDLPQEATEDIYHRNAERVFRIEP